MFNTSEEGITWVWRTKLDAYGFPTRYRSRINGPEDIVLSGSTTVVRYQRGRCRGAY